MQYQKLNQQKYKIFPLKCHPSHFCCNNRLNTGLFHLAYFSKKVLYFILCLKVCLDFLGILYNASFSHIACDIHITSLQYLFIGCDKLKWSLNQFSVLFSLKELNRGIFFKLFKLSSLSFTFTINIFHRTITCLFMRPFYFKDSYSWLNSTYCLIHMPRERRSSICNWNMTEE